MLILVFLLSVGKKSFFDTKLYLSCGVVITVRLFRKQNDQIVPPCPLFGSSQPGFRFIERPGSLGFFLSRN